MSSTLYQSPWRNSIVMAPSGRSFGQGFTPKPAPTPIHRSSVISAESFPPDRDLLEGLAEEPFQEVVIPLDGPEQDDVKVVDCMYIGSYDWVKENIGTPIILVPGSPHHWQNRQVPYTIPPDRGVNYRDLDGYKMPKAVLLPLVVAVNKRTEMACMPLFDWSSVDIVTDRDNLLKLTGWVSGLARDFRIDLQLAGEKTILMTRWSERYMELFNGRTYGHSFEKESTVPAPGCKNTAGHHRIVTYDLNGLKMVVRFGVDACLRPPAKYPRRSMSAIDELSQSLLPGSISQSTFRSEYPIIVREGGAEVSSAAVIELATQSQAIFEARGFDWKAAYPQLFFSQTANHYLAVHKHGRFFSIEKRKLSSDEMQAEEKGAQGDLKKVRKALDVVKELVLAHGKKGRLSLVCKDGLMKVYHRSSDEGLLPNAVMKLFEASSL